MTALDTVATQRRPVVPQSRPMVIQGRPPAAQHRPMSPQRVRPATGRTRFNPMDFIVITTSVVRPVIVTVAVLAAAVASATPSHADPGDATSPVLNGVGIGNDGAISSAIAQVGQSICPMLVQPGSSLASGATQISGHGGLAPPIAGFLAGMAIKAQCPGFMTSVANGDMPFPISGAMPGGGSPISLPFPGTAP